MRNLEESKSWDLWTKRTWKHRKKHKPQDITMMHSMYFYCTKYIHHEQAQMVNVVFCKIDATSGQKKNICTLSSLAFEQPVLSGMVRYGLSRWLKEVWLFLDTPVTIYLCLPLPSPEQQWLLTHPGSGEHSPGEMVKKKRVGQVMNQACTCVMPRFMIVTPAGSQSTTGNGCFFCRTGMVVLLFLGPCDANRILPARESGW